MGVLKHISIEELKDLFIGPSIITVFYSKRENIELNVNYSDEIFVEIICPSLISPFNTYNLYDSVSSTLKLLCLEEGPTFGGLCSEATASLIENNLNGFVMRRLGNNTVIPNSFDAETDLLINSTQIIDSLLEMK